MNSKTLCLSTAAALIMGSSLPAVAEITGDLNVHVGARELRDDNFWGPLDGQFSIGLESRLGSTRAPLFLDFGFQFSADEEDTNGGEVTATVFEAYIGPTLAPWYGKRVSPYIGVGVSGVLVDVENDPVAGPTVEDDDDDNGLYAHIGVNFLIGRGFNLGLQYRMLRDADVNVFGSQGNVDYDQFTLVSGWHWGPRDAKDAGPALPPVAVVTPVPAPAPVQVTPPTPKVVALSRGAAEVQALTPLRYQPHGGAEVDQLLAPGTEVDLQYRRINESGSWWYVQIGRNHGWILERDLTQGDPPPGMDSVQPQPTPPAAEASPITAIPDSAP